MNGASNKVLEPLVEFARQNDIKICFNAGTTSIKKGMEHIKKILESAHVVVMNREEACMTTGVQVRPDTKTEKFSQEVIHDDIKKMLALLKIKDYQVVVITDGKKGAYAYDGKQYYYCPIFPSEVVSTLGAGDSFASTFCSTLFRNNKDIGRALMYGSVNSASVVSQFGATEGLLTFEEIEARLATRPDYSYLIG